MNYYRFEFRGKTYEIGKNIINLKTGKRVRSSEYGKEEYDSLYKSNNEDEIEITLEIVVTEIVSDFLDKWAAKNELYSEDPLVIREFYIKYLKLPDYIPVSNDIDVYKVSVNTIVDDWIDVNF